MKDSRVSDALEVLERGFAAQRVARHLCKAIGPRPSASTAIEEAREFLRAEWSSFGAQGIHAETVPLVAWEPRGCVVKVGNAHSEAITALHCVGSAAGSVTAPVLDAGNLTALELNTLGPEAHGSIFLIAGSQISGGPFEAMQKRVSLAEAAGAAGILIAGRHRQLPSIEYIKHSHVPVAGISEEAADRIAAMRKERIVQAAIEVDGRSRRTQCASLAAEINAGQPADGNEVIILCAHLDSFSIAPGAIDNITGVATVCEIARALAPLSPQFKRTLRIIAFTGEEYGYAGSKHYVRKHAEELDRIRFVVSLDCLFEETAQGMAVMWSPAMRDYLAVATQAGGNAVDIRNHYCMSSDYLPFMLAGIPAARPADWKNNFPPWTHTTEDTFDKISFAALRANARLLVPLLARMLTDEQIPTQRMSPAHVAEAIRQEDAEDSLRWQIVLP